MTCAMTDASCIQSYTQATTLDTFLAGRTQKKKQKNPNEIRSKRSKSTCPLWRKHPRKKRHGCSLL